VQLWQSVVVATLFCHSWMQVFSSIHAPAQYMQRHVISSLAIGCAVHESCMYERLASAYQDAHVRLPPQVGPTWHVPDWQARPWQQNCVGLHAVPAGWQVAVAHTLFVQIPEQQLVAEAHDAPA
jgi:hypothetical protein